MKSMTGFGTGAAALGQGKVIVDARSVNHRHLDVRVRLPLEMADQGLFLEQRARERLSRGRFDLSVRFEGLLLSPRLDLDRARSLYREMQLLRDELAPGTDLPVAALVGLPDLYVAPVRFQHEEAQAALGAAVDGALSDLEAMRGREGVALKAELAARLRACRRVRERIEARLPEALKSAEARLRTRVERLTSDLVASFDQGRLETEIAMIADRTDITEELVRLESHFGQLESLLDSREPMGRRLDFLLQEVAREANTVGAKSQDAELSHLVVELKSDIERIREQVQNVE